MSAATAVHHATLTVSLNPHGNPADNHSYSLFHRGQWLVQFCRARKWWFWDSNSGLFTANTYITFFRLASQPGLSESPGIKVKFLSYSLGIEIQSVWDMSWQEGTYKHIYITSKSCSKRNSLLSWGCSQTLSMPRNRIFLVLGHWCHSRELTGFPEDVKYL